MSTNAATVMKDVVMAVIIRLGPIDVHAPTDIYYIRMAKLAEVSLLCRPVHLLKKSDQVVCKIMFSKYVNCFSGKLNMNNM